MDGKARKDAEVSGPLGIIQNQRGRGLPESKCQRERGWCGRSWCCLLAGERMRSWYGEQVVLYMFVMLVWVSAVLDRDVYHELWPPPPWQRPSYVFRTDPSYRLPFDLAPYPTPTLFANVWSRGCHVPKDKKGPAAQTLQRQNKAKTNAPPRTTSHHPETRPSPIVTGMVCWLDESGCADQPRNSLHEAISGENRMPLQTHLLPQASPSVA